MIHDSLYNVIARPFAEVIAGLTGQDAATVDPQVRAAGDPQFGDYQCNAALALAKQLKAKPRDLAQRIKDAVEPRLADMVEPLEIAGPGFLNIRLRSEFLAGRLSEIPAPPEVEAATGRPEGIEGSRDRGIKETSGAPRPHVPTSSAAADSPAPDRVGLPPTDRPLRVVVEYSQPNIAKQMHVGHLRSTIIGDVFARVLAFQGHDVIRQNHIGDWGTQFGMLIRWYRDHTLPTPATHDDVLDAIEQDYKAANERFKQDEQFATAARLAVGQLQSGDPAARQLWERICKVSLDAIDVLYNRLNVLLRDEDVRGESFYNDRLQPLVDELRRQLPVAADSNPPPFQGGVGGGSEAAHVVPSPDPSLKGRGVRAEVKDDQGAVCVFLYDENGEPQFKDREERILPLIIQKSDGAFLYASTDLAAIRFRLRDLEFPTGRGAQRVVYVTDARQRLHFAMWMATARVAGWIDATHRVEHVTFGSVLGEDRRPLKTREGGTIKLRDLLDEAERRALELLESRDAETQRRRDEGEDEAAGLPDQREIARAVGIAAVKYADLRNDRNSDYVFTWDKMISFQGNTAPYMMYAYARIRSIYRKAAEQSGSPDVYAPTVKLTLTEPAERALALRLARLSETIDSVATDLLPHVLCAYLYDVATDFMRFYETCSVLQAPDAASRLSRLRLCDLTARTLRLGLGLLGIDVLERM